MHWMRYQVIKKKNTEDVKEIKWDGARRKHFEGEKAYELASVVFSGSNVK